MDNEKQPPAMVATMEAENDMVLVPRGLLGAAISAIDKQRAGVTTLACLRHYAYNGKKVTHDDKA